MKINPGTDTGRLLLEYIQKNPIAMFNLAPKIGISIPTIKTLLTTDVEPRLMTQMKIEKFIKEESEKNLVE